MLKKENADIASADGIVVYIEVPFEVCYKRIAGDKNRPIVMSNTKEELEFIYGSRVPVYKKFFGIGQRGRLCRRNCGTDNKFNKINYSKLSVRRNPDRFFE